MTPTSDLTAQLTAMLAPVAGAEAEGEARRIVEAARAARPGDFAELATRWAQRRCEGVPLGQILGRQRFLGVELMVGSNVLSPREETEILGREALAFLRELASMRPGDELRIIDMGCGSGNLACALAVAMPQLRVWASDISEDCAELTRANVARLSLQDRVQVFAGDLFAPLADLGLANTIDMVVMNPPYIPSTSLEKGRAELLRHEPREAFDGGPYGISILGRLIEDSPPFLKEGGALLFEFGIAQERMIKAVVARKGHYTRSRMAQDSQGKPRVMVLQQ